MALLRLGELVNPFDPQQAPVFAEDDCPQMKTVIVQYTTKSSRDLHVAGDTNEFDVPAHCTNPIAAALADTASKLGTDVDSLSRRVECITVIQ